MGCPCKDKAKKAIAAAKRKLAELKGKING